MLKPLENTGLLNAIAQNDERAFRAVFDQYHQQLAAFVFSITRSRELTEEIIQDVFLKIWEERNSLPELKSFTAYLFIVTRNHTLNAIRKISQVRKKQEAVNRHLIQTEEEEIPVENYYALLDNAVDQLPMQQKRVFLLRQQGLKNADIAYQMNISVHSVKKYQQWALQAIARLIKTGAFLLISIFF
ncbi:RNA polymerase sigma factor [Pseudobacter ginsenosidimutans]|uniref:RNA polymerase sigma factor n=1 Tax=Pseudobacter ginsenosidimutans TaxID=661488 RepID=A0A4Q7MRW4_9BACT|nr:sigma-70 family RNA polymerase sigma factor [Pseudobacter ginsenosidimutans]QEC41700.1 sigma-70 family RNA polymerase sigma factor [Pseudobacter ginsenosidimutans]RZS71495.1 RNA polymerase ECF family sigma subunit [Pseudobacter ginsenosidimutans]